MNRGDALIPRAGSGEAIATTSTGDMQIVRGQRSLEERAQRLWVNPQSRPMHRPSGIGLAGALGRAGLGTLASVAATAERRLREDPDVAEVAILVEPSATSPGRTTVSATITTVDDPGDNAFTTILQ